MTGIRYFDAEHPDGMCLRFPHPELGEVLEAENPQNHGTFKPFKFNQVFGPGSSQERVFQEVAPLVERAMDGYNVCVFAYGQSGSGKTFTMVGPGGGQDHSGGGELAGLTPRTIRRLFKLVEQRTQYYDTEVTIEMYELYNNKIQVRVHCAAYRFHLLREFAHNCDSPLTHFIEPPGRDASSAAPGREAPGDHNFFR